MQDDVTWGAKYLVQEGIADPKRIGIMGGSYGGYATLAGVAFTPDVYAAAVSIVGPSNLITLLDSIPPYWEQIRKLFYERMGDPNTPAGKAQLERQSPLNAAAKIKTPLLVIQGANDPRVKKAESDQIVVALRDRGFPVEYLVAPDEGHGFARPVNNMSAFATAEKFFAKHLGGRYQAELTPEVATRLKEITVDPKTVTMPARSTAVSAAVPTLDSTLQAGASSYTGTIELAGQKMPFSVNREIRADADAWTIVETAKMPMGEVTDTTTLAKDTLVLKKRTIAQGPVKMAFSIEGGQAKGQIDMGGQNRPIDVAVGGDLFADGAGAHAVVAALPLADGYTTAFRNLDLQTQKVKVVELKVVGAESVTVPAGTFDAFKVELLSADDGQKTTLWVGKADRKVVRTSSVVPRMNGAVVTTELQK
jgi:dienelactone hydrolase